MVDLSLSAVAFRDIARPLLHRGYSPLPVLGKQPKVKGWQCYGVEPPDDPTLKQWINQFPRHNVGAACGRLVALDIDDETELGAADLQRRAFEAFGPTPLIRIGRAPRRVLLYQAVEPFRSLKRPIAQVLALGSQVVLFGEHPLTRRPYAWPEATPIDVPLCELPVVTEAGVSAWLGVQRAPASSKRQRSPRAPSVPTSLPVRPGTLIERGHRNDALFHQALALAPVTGSVEELAGRLRQLNEIYCSPPLEASEVEAAARSTWRYRETDRLFVPGGIASAVISKAELDRLSDEPAAIVLLMLLRVEHGARIEPFALATHAMSEAKLIAQWSRRTYEQARDILIDRGLLERVRIGGGRGNPHLYVLRKPARLAPQYNPTFSSFPCLQLIDQSGSKAKVREGSQHALALPSPVASEPTLFEAKDLPAFLTPDAQQRATINWLLSQSPRGTHTRLAQVLGVSSQHLTNWKKGRSRLNRAAGALVQKLAGSSLGSFEIGLRGASIPEITAVEVMR